MPGNDYRSPRPPTLHVCKKIPTVRQTRHVPVRFPDNQACWWKRGTSDQLLLTFDETLAVPASFSLTDTDWVSHIISSRIIPLSEGFYVCFYVRAYLLHSPYKLLIAWIYTVWVKQIHSFRLLRDILPKSLLKFKSLPLDWSSLNDNSNLVSSAV